MLGPKEKEKDSLKSDRPSGRATVHSVFFYDHDAALIERLAGIVASGLVSGNAVLVVATEEHRRYLVKSLCKRGIDASRVEIQGMLGLFDAQTMLNMFMVNGHPERSLFDASVGVLLVEAKRAASEESQGLTVFGEMVAVLWEQGNKQGALELEGLWNDVLNERDFYLHCAYSRRAFSPQDESRLSDLCHSHSHVFGAPAPVQ